jgi:hypothetical protein
MRSTTARRRWYQPFAIAIVFVLSVTIYVASSVVYLHYPAQYFIPPAAATPYLPFDMPSGPSTKKVFAHYVPWVPISIDNQPAENDYYSTQLNTPTGEGGVHAVYGGYLRDRPLPRPPIASADWRDIDLRTDVNQAKSVGIDGFAVDVVLPAAQVDTVNRLLTVAQTVAGFSIQITADMSGPFGGNFSETNMAAEFAPYLRHPAAQRLSDNRVVLGAFYAERKPPAWWQNLLNILRNTYQINVAFVPTFLDADANMSAFAPFSYGFSNWGGRNPITMSATDTNPGSAIDLVRRANALGKIWMQSVAFQDNRPKGGIFEESQNGTLNRNSWRIAIDEQVEWANLITWNDYAEMTAYAPSVKHGWRLLDMSAYRIARFKFGAFPPILRDAVYVTYRTQPVAAQPQVPQTVLMRNIGATPAQDTVEVEAYSREPSTVVATIGGRSLTCNVPAGFGVCTFPLGLGGIAVGLFRSGACQQVVNPTWQVTAAPHVQDVQYTAAGGLR